MKLHLRSKFSNDSTATKVTTACGKYIERRHTVNYRSELFDNQLREKPLACANCIKSLEWVTN